LRFVLRFSRTSQAELTRLGFSQIACYKNTVKAYRSGAQTDLSEVIQIDNVFTNVTKGAVAPTADLQKAFGTTDIQTVLLEVLKKGELQVGEKERAVELEEMRREIATEVAGRCVDPGTQRPHTVGMIEKSMNEIGYSVNLSKPAKVQVSFEEFGDLGARVC
jgi:ribosome maturation protein SDO1